MPEKCSRLIRKTFKGVNGQGIETEFKETLHLPQWKQLPSVQVEIEPQGWLDHHHNAIFLSVCSVNWQISTHQFESRIERKRRLLPRRRYGKFCSQWRCTLWPRPWGNSLWRVEKKGAPTKSGSSGFVNWSMDYGAFCIQPRSLGNLLGITKRVADSISKQQSPFSLRHAMNSWMCLPPSGKHYKKIIGMIIFDIASRESIPYRNNNSPFFSLRGVTNSWILLPPSLGKHSKTF
jgi:hypothetical protein